MQFVRTGSERIEMTRTLYDQIGTGYSQRRRPDPRIEELIHSALGKPDSVANVGAGAGSYEPRGCRVIAIEPSAEMIRQRTPDSNFVVQAVAERIPLRTHAVDAAMAILTLHHWSDWRQGVHELRRVARGRIVIMTWDPEFEGFWLTDRYFPRILELDKTIFPTTRDIARELGGGEILKVPIPHDCVDGMLGAYWRRPAAYLDAGTRSSISSFARLPGMDEGLRQLEAELRDGTWKDLYGELLSQDDLDIGYRLVIT